MDERKYQKVHSLLASMLVPRSTPAHHVIPGLTRNPLHIPSWIPDQCHLAGSVTSGMTYPVSWRTANAVDMDDRKYRKVHSLLPSKLILRSTPARGRDNRYPQAVKALYQDTEGPPARYPHPMRGFTGRRGRGMESSAKGLTVRIS